MCVPGFESIDPCIKRQTFCLVLFGPHRSRQNTGNTLQILFHPAASERCCQLGLTPVTNTHHTTASFIINVLLILCRTISWLIVFHETISKLHLLYIYTHLCRLLSRSLTSWWRSSPSVIERSRSKNLRSWKSNSITIANGNKSPDCKTTPLSSSLL